MNILVTGAAGFIGSHTTEKLLELGHTVVGVDNFTDFYDVSFKEQNITGFSEHKAFTLARVDIRDQVALRELFSTHLFDLVIHLAAQAGIRYSTEHPIEAVEVNEMGTVYIFDLAKEFNVPKVIYASSSSVYGDSDAVPFSEDDKLNDPISMYAATKASNELVAHAYHHLYGIRMIGLRFFTVYGERGRPDMAPYRFTDMIMNEKELTRYGDGSMERDFTYIDDIVSGIVACIDTDLSDEVINLGHSNAYTLNHFIASLEDIIGKKAHVVELPVPESDVRKTHANIDRAQELLGWTPKTDLQTGLTHFVDWFKVNRT